MSSDSDRAATQMKAMATASSLKALDIMIMLLHGTTNPIQCLAFAAKICSSLEKQNPLECIIAGKMSWN
jgi:hypothetical protein